MKTFLRYLETSNLSDVTSKFRVVSMIVICSSYKLIWPILLKPDSGRDEYCSFICCLTTLSTQTVASYDRMNIELKRIQKEAAVA